MNGVEIELDPTFWPSGGRLREGRLLLGVS
jgi:hypothetical protein